MASKTNKTNTTKNSNIKKDNKKISVNQLERICNIRTKTIPYTLEDEEEFNIIIHPVLSLDQMIEFVAEVVSSVVDRESGVYTPEAEEFAIRRAVLTRYANFTMPSNLSKMYDLIFNSSVYGVVVSNIDDAQFESIKRSIRSKVDHEKAMIESSATTHAEEILHRLDSLASEFNNIIGDLEGVDAVSILKELGNGDILDERKITDAVLDRMESVPDSNLPKNGELNIDD